jgi:hypothetical protein
MSILFLFTILFSIYICFLYNKKQTLYKKDLQNIFEKEKQKKYDNILNEEFIYIYNNIIQNAKIGKNKLSFMVFCNPYVKKPEFNESSFEVYEETETELNKDIIITSNILSEELQNMYNFSVKSLEFDFLVKLHKIFPDANLTCHKKDEKQPYCDYYTLSW